MPRRKPAALSRQAVARARLRWLRATLQARHAERRYVLTLTQIAREVGAVYERYLRKAMAATEAKGDAVKGPSGSGPANPRRAVAAVRATIQPQIEKRVAKAARVMFEAVDEASASYANMLGFTPVQIGPDVKAAYEARLQANVDLVVNAQRDYADQVVRIFTDPENFGRRVEDLAEELQARTGVAESRAALIARDQTLKTLGELNKTRQEAAGVTQYIWCTSGDNAVREEHADRDGRIFSWDDPPEGGHPGDDFQCRCSATPVVDEAEGIFD